MKVNLKHRQQNYSGACDGLVYYSTRRGNQLYARRYVRPRYTAANQTLGNNTRHLETLRPSQAYIDDLRQYISIYNARLWQDEPPLRNWHAQFVRLMYAQARALAIPLTSLTRDLIDDQMLPCRSVKRAVEAGFLMPVAGYERLVNAM